MLKLSVENMTCGHCVKAIKNAILEQDASAIVNVDLERKQVEIESTLEANQMISILEEEGYPTQVLG